MSTLQIVAGFEALDAATSWLAITSMMHNTKWLEIYLQFFLAKRRRFKYNSVYAITVFKNKKHHTYVSFHHTDGNSNF